MDWFLYDNGLRHEGVKFYSVHKLNVFHRGAVTVSRHYEDTKCKIVDTSDSHLIDTKNIGNRGIFRTLTNIYDGEFLRK